MVNGNLIPVPAVPAIDSLPIVMYNVRRKGTDNLQQNKYFGGGTYHEDPDRAV